MPELTMSQIDKELLEDRVSRANGGLPWKVLHHQISRDDYGAIIAFVLDCGDVSIEAQTSTSNGIEKLYGFHIRGDKDAAINLIKQQFNKAMEAKAQQETEIASAVEENPDAHGWEPSLEV